MQVVLTKVILITQIQRTVEIFFKIIKYWNKRKHLILNKKFLNSKVLLKERRFEPNNKLNIFNTKIIQFINNNIILKLKETTMAKFHKKPYNKFIKIN